MLFSAQDHPNNPPSTWVFEPTPDSDPPRFHVGTPEAGGFISVCGTYADAGPRAEIEANARLIAAAPDLLAVCKALAERGAVIATTGLGEQLDSAIARAEGRT